MKFWLGLKFVINLYIIAAFITLLVLGVVNLIKKVTEKNS